MKNKSGKRKIHGRTVIIAVIVVAITVVPLLMFKLISRNIVKKITETISLQHSQELNASMSANISNSLEYFFSELNIEFDALKQIDNLDEEKLKTFISDAEKHNGISYLAFADDNGYICEAGGSYLGTMRISVLGQLLNGEKNIVTGNITIAGESYIILGTAFDDPIEAQGHRICAGIIGMTNDELAESIILHSNFSGGYSSIISTDGSYIIKNPAEPYGGLNIFSILNKSYAVSETETEALKQKIQSGGSCILSAAGADSSGTVYMYFAPLEGTEWYAVNTLPSAFIGDSIDELQKSVSTVYIAFIAFIILIAVIIVLQQTSSSRSLKRTGKELEKALQSAEDASNAKTEFLFNMSHDIRTPMNAILGYTDIGLSHINDRERVQDSFRKIKSSGDHLLNLINDILEMSRIESGKLVLNEHPVDIIKVIDGISAMGQALALPKSIEFNTVKEGIRSRYIYADELHTNEIIINLLSNAVKYTRDGGRVSYKITQLDDTADGEAVFRFEISDTGIGMSREFQEHLFEAFSREQNSTVSKIEGAGLGLSIVKNIVDIAGGTIAVKSELGVGSTFTVELRFAVLDKEAEAKFIAESSEAEEITESVSLSGRRVLLVEDNEINREIATMLLEDAGLEVETAQDGEIAVGMVSGKKIGYYDFVLMDIQMPVMNGYEATRAIRNLPDGDKVRIIALSANAFEEDRRKSAEAGTNAHVAKPIDINELLGVMNELANK